MRIRSLLTAGLLAAVAVVAFAPGALAQEEGEGGDATEFTEEQIEEITHEAELIGEENGGTTEDGHCIAILIDGGSVDECQEAPSPIMPPTNELIWGSISFVLLFALLAKFAYPGIKKGMEGRTERIRSDLEGAESAKADAQRVLEEYRAQLADAKAESGRIIEEARQQADALKRDAEQRLQTELGTMRERAAADVEGAKAQALADLRGDVANLVAEGVDRVVRGGLDAATQQRLVDEYINSLAARTN
jgi:F-type H+-transporting ATPase subunit b